MDMQLDQTILPLGDLLDALKAQGFQPGLEARFRLRRWMDRLALMDQPLASDTLKYQLSALLAVSAEAQDLFYQIYDQWAAPFWQIDESAEPLSGSTNDEEQKEQQEELVNEEDTTPKDAGNLTDDTRRRHQTRKNRRHRCQRAAAVARSASSCCFPTTACASGIPLKWIRRFSLCAKKNGPSCANGT